MAEELSSPNHYVACTGDYDCAADEHIEGCGIVDKRAADEQQHDPYDAAERDLVEYIRKHRPVNLAVNLSDRSIYQRSTYVVVYGPGDSERRVLPLDG